MDGTPESSQDRRSHPSRRRAGAPWLAAVPDEAPGPGPVAAGTMAEQPRQIGIGLAELPVAALFGGLTRARGARIFHPSGSGYAAEATITPHGRHTGAPLLDTPGSYRAAVRFSRGAGLPDPLPDVLGLAIKIIDAHGEGRDQDLLLATSAGMPVGRHLLLPATGFLGRQFSSVLPYLVGRHIRLFGARPVTPAMHDGGTALAEVHVAAATGGLRFDLMIASEMGGWHRIGLLLVGRSLDPDEADRLRYNPWHTGPGIRPIGPWQDVRRSAYVGSQRQRD